MTAEKGYKTLNSIINYSITSLVIVFDLNFQPYNKQFSNGI